MSIQTYRQHTHKRKIKKKKINLLKIYRTERRAKEKKERKVEGRKKERKNRPEGGAMHLKTRRSSFLEAAHAGLGQTTSSDVISPHGGP